MNCPRWFNGLQVCVAVLTLFLRFPPGRITSRVMDNNAGRKGWFNWRWTTMTRRIIHSRRNLMPPSAVKQFSLPRTGKDAKPVFSLCLRRKILGNKARKRTRFYCAPWNEKRFGNNYVLNSHSTWLDSTIETFSAKLKLVENQIALRPFSIPSPCFPSASVMDLKGFPKKILLR